MAAEKTATLTFRLDPALKEALKVAAQQDRRSITNMVEVLIRQHCDKSGIEIADMAPSSDSGERSGR